MAKRIADKELTDRNWDQEEEGEEAGTFSLASQDVLKGRAIKKAKRRNVGAENEGGGAFRSFKGFALSSTVGGAANPAAGTASSGGSGGASLAFSGFGNGGGFKGLGGLTNGTSSTPTFGGFSGLPTSSTGPGLTFNSPASSETKQTNGSPSLAPQASPCSGAAGAAGGSSKEYRRQLTALNVSVRDWITKHVNDNPLCDLNPIFRDYERHLASIEKQYGAKEGGAEEKQQDAATSSSAPPPAAAAAAGTPSSSSSSLFSFSKTEEKSATSSLPTGVTFNFGQKVDSSVLGTLGSAPSFSFSSTSSSSSAPSLFGSTAAAPLSFGGAKTDNAQPADDNAEESEEPPKPEVKEVKEDDAFYSKKCKMFYKKDAEFKEKGVGTLHLKETAEGKTQMIIRADTNLGNILLNILVPSSMPCTRVGKNNVMVVCVPNPALDDKSPSSTVPLLIRVKTAEDADELHKILEEKKS
ncbi:unnamed protein product [Ophioblennius macclurei]